MKSVFLTVSALVCVLALVCGAQGARVVREGGECGDGVNWEFDDLHVLTISGNGYMTNFTASDTSIPWYSKLSSIVTIVVEDGVLSIGSYAFANSGVQSVTIGKDVTFIGAYAFSLCRSLSAVTIPSEVKTISEGTFSGCFSLSSVNITDNVEVIDTKAFESCTTLETLSLPSGLKSIGNLSFKSTGLEAISIPEGATSIGCNAFDSCDKLVNVSIPSTVTFIGDFAFLGCSKLASLVVGDGNAKYKTDDNVLFNQDGSVLVLYPEGKEDATYTVPDSVGTIKEYAFTNAKILNELTIKANVKKINKNAFESCSGLNKVTLPSSLDVIEPNTFSGCTNLTSIAIPDGVTAIGEYAFEGCIRLSDVSIPESVRVIGTRAFKGCGSIVQIFIPSGVETLGSGAFASTALKKVVILPTVTSIEVGAFDGCNKLTQVYYLGYQKYETKAFTSCSALEKVCVPPDYEGSTFCDANVTPDKCEDLTKLFNHCYYPSYTFDSFYQLKRDNATKWELHTNTCGVFVCDNATGPIAWSACNSSDDNSRLCMKEKCIDNYTTTLEGWYVDIEFDGVNFTLIDASAIDATIAGLGANATVGISADPEGQVTHIILDVADQAVATLISNGVQALANSSLCEYQYGVLCDYKEITVRGPESSSEKQSSSAVSIHASVLALLAIIALLMASF